MANLVLKAILGSKNQREVRRLKPLVARINELEQQYQKLSDDEVRAKSLGWKSDLANIDDPDELARRLNEILPEAFALVKNAARRHWDKTWQVCDQPVMWNMIHFDVQLMGGIALHQGKIAEMATGEGKTLVATCPIYLNALSGRGAHLVTVNDYLARRDAEWM
jgi:preprotein translocase subunit SecA